jgi:phenylalanine ammonia-lyase
MPQVLICGERLTLEELVGVARIGTSVGVFGESVVREKVDRSRAFVLRSLAAGRSLYGVTTGFGAMSHISISPAEAAELQANLLCFLKTGCGDRLASSDVRAGMLLRANSLARGVSGVRWELIERLILFLNEGVTPHVKCLGSIGASGDLVPLSYVAGALIGASEDYLVDYRGRILGAVAVLRELGLERLTLEPKEGLALVNGTSILTGIAAGCAFDAQRLFSLALAVHSLMLQALRASRQPFHPFIHQHKPHPGQRSVAAWMDGLLAESGMIRDGRGKEFGNAASDSIQDRYSVRCLPQFLGPIVDGLSSIRRQIEIEMNSATDNPLLDVDRDACYHGGNFLGQYAAVAMDQCRYYLGLLSKHLDVQISVLMEPAFNGGLSGSLVGNPARAVNMGLKGLQIAGNSIMPLIGFYGNSIADRFPTHAEQFNQNINSQGMGSALLARKTVDLAFQHIAIALIVGIQAVELRTHQMAGHYDARELLSPAAVPLYEASFQVLDRRAGVDRPLVFDDCDQSLDHFLSSITDDLSSGGRLFLALESVCERVTAHRADVGV